jgi:catechol 2,3-dioxygenase-like lactoylglutathione lyase family enzyme
MSDSFVPQVIENIHHVALRTTDLPRLVHFYHETIGLPITRTRGPEGDPDAVWLPGVQLVKASGELEPSGTLDHLAIGIDNVEELCARLDAAGVKVDRPLAKIVGTDGVPFAFAGFYYDPDGNRVEVFKLI